MFNKILLSILALSIVATSSIAKEKPTLIFYCGITMVKPMQEITKIIEKRNNV